MQKKIKIILAILFFLSLASMPYGFYQFVRLIAFGGFTYLAYLERNLINRNTMLLYVGLAILFQPFFMIHLGRGLWTVVDVVVGSWLLFSLRNRK
jgi:hypothetical protein